MKLLIVDDDPAVATTLGMYLELRGHSVAVARDGLEGLDAMQRIEFEGLAADVSMPNMSGIEMIETARAQGRLPSRVVVVTGRDKLWYVEKLRGVAKVFEKPADPAEIEFTLTGEVPCG